MGSEERRGLNRLEWIVTRAWFEKEEVGKRVMMNRRLCLDVMDGWVR